MNPLITHAVPSVTAVHVSTLAIDAPALQTLCMMTPFPDPAGYTSADAHQLVMALASFDGVRTQPLETAAERFPPSPERCDLLVQLAQDPDLRMQTAATWLLARWIESGTALLAPQVSILLHAADPVDSWQARLHLCQAFAAATVPSGTLPLARRYFRLWTADTRAFVRAWAYAALARTVLPKSGGPAHEASANRRLRTEIEVGLQDAAPSVRARVRRVLKGWPSNAPPAR